MHRSWLGKSAAWGLLWLGLLICGTAQAQVTVGDMTKLSLGADLSFGYSGVYAGNASNSTELDVGGTATATGYYYNPNFLNFRVNPFYNRTGVNSSFQSVFRTSGVVSALNLFAGSKTPISVSFDKEFNSEGQFSIPGTPGVVTNGDSQTFGVSGGVFIGHLPTLQLGYSRSSNHYDVLGLHTSGSGRSEVFTVGSSYTALGFNLGANFSDSNITQDQPLIADTSERFINNTKQQTFQATASRYLGFDSANIASNYSHTHFVTDYTGTPLDQTYDSVSSTFDIRPLKRLNLQAGVNYATNYSALLLFSVINPAGTNKGGLGTSASDLPPGERAVTSDFMNYGATAHYMISDAWNVDAGVARREETYQGFDYSGTTAQSGVGYSHSFTGGSMAAHYGINWYSATGTTNSGVGHNATATFNKVIMGWRTGSSVQYSRNQATAIAAYTSTGYGTTFNLAHNLPGRWNLLLGGRWFKSTVNGLSNSDSATRGFNVALNGGRFSVDGGYNHTSGTALQTGTGLNIGPGPIILPGQVILFGGDSYNVGSSFHPSRFLMVTGAYVHAQYSTRNFNSSSDNTLSRIEIRSEYYFRQLRLIGGYARITQGLGASFASPPTYQSIYAGISRHFDFF